MKTLCLLSILLLSACSVFDNEQDIENSDIIATANDPVFSVLNKSEQSILFLVIETNTAAVIDLADPCIDFNPNLAPNSKTQLNYSDIWGWKQGDDSVWFYWTDCKGSGESKTIKL
ncbi:MAG: hypothetical protein ACMZ7B_12450 [Balneola sp.]